MPSLRAQRSNLPLKQHRSTNTLQHYTPWTATSLRSSQRRWVDFHSLRPRRDNEASWPPRHLCSYAVFANAVKQSTSQTTLFCRRNRGLQAMDCHVATLLAETIESCRYVTRRDGMVDCHVALLLAEMGGWAVTSLYSSQRRRGA